MIAENIAFGQSTPKAAMESWMSSDGHRENILNKEATTIGIGCVTVDGVRYWVQCFGSNKATKDCQKPKDRSCLQKVNIATRTFEAAATSRSGVEFSFGESGSYTIRFSLTLKREKVKAGSRTTAKLSVVNPETLLEVPVARVFDSTWKTSNKKVAKLGSAGALRPYTFVRGVKPGTATIAWKGRSLSANAQVTVRR